MRAATLISRARKRAGLSQAELARRAGTSQPVISAYEHGHRDPSVTSLRRLIAATGVELQLSAAPRARRPETPPAVTDAEHATRLVDLLLLTDAIPRRGRRGLLTFPRLES